MIQQDVFEKGADGDKSEHRRLVHVSLGLVGSSHPRCWVRLCCQSEFDTVIHHAFLVAGIVGQALLGRDFIKKFGEIPSG